MTRELVLVHGRSQHDRDPDELKAEWVEALHKGLGRCGLTLPIPESAIRFPFYGDALRDMTDRADEAVAVADIVIRGDGSKLDPHHTRFLVAALHEAALATGAEENELSGVDSGSLTGRGMVHTERLRTLLAVLDRRVPALGGALIARVMLDVHTYLTVRAIAARIDDGVREAFGPSGKAAVVVAHSLGSVVAYCLLRGQDLSARKLITLGSPLGVSVIRRALRPLAHPPGVGRWLNARDVRDVIALHPLDATRFPVRPPIEDLATVDNHTPNRHGIAGYLSAPDVAARIHDALREDAEVRATDPPGETS